MISTDPETSETTVMLFHSCSNPREQHMNRAVEAEEDVGCLRFQASTFLPALKFLLAAGSKYVRVKDLPLLLEDDRVALCENLSRMACWSTKQVIQRLPQLGLS